MTFNCSVSIHNLTKVLKRHRTRLWTVNLRAHVSFVRCERWVQLVAQWLKRLSPRQWESGVEGSYFGSDTLLSLGVTPVHNSDRRVVVTSVYNISFVVKHMSFLFKGSDKETVTSPCLLVFRPSCRVRFILSLRDSTAPVTVSTRKRRNTHFSMIVNTCFFLKWPKGRVELVVLSLDMCQMFACENGWALIYRVCHVV